MLTFMLPARLISKFHSKKNGKRTQNQHRCDELSERLDAFTFRQRLGCGAFGQVFLAETSSTGEEKVVAVKIVRRSKLFKRSTRGFALAEAANLAHMSASGSLFFTQLHETFCDAHNLYIVTDFLPGGSLHSEMSRRGKTIPNDRIVLIAAQLVEALAQLHAAKIIHRDIKPDNILLDACGNIVLTDFGLSRKFEPESRNALSIPMRQALQVSTTQSVFPEMRAELGVEEDDTGEKARKPYMSRTGCGTLDHAAPEMLRGELYSFSADIYSFGVVFHKLLFGSMPPFPSSSASMPTHPDAEPSIPLPPSVASVNTVAWDFCTSLLASNPLHRPSAAALRSHPLFAGISWPTLSARAYVLPSHHAPPCTSLHRKWEYGPGIFIDRNVVSEDEPSGAFEAAYNGKEKMTLVSRPGEPRKWRSQANGVVCDALEAVLQIRDCVVGRKDRVRRRKWAKDVQVAMEVPFVRRRSREAVSKEASPTTNAPLAGADFDLKLSGSKSSSAAVDGHVQIHSPRISKCDAHSELRCTNMRILRRVTKRIPPRPRILLPVLSSGPLCTFPEHQEGVPTAEAVTGLAEHDSQNTISLALAQVLSPRLSPSPDPSLYISHSGRKNIKRPRPVLSRLNTSLPLSRSSSSLSDSRLSPSEHNVLFILAHELQNVLPSAQSTNCPSLAVSLSSLPPTPGPVTPVRGNSIVPAMAGETNLNAKGPVKPSGLPSGARGSDILFSRNLQCAGALML